MEVGQFCGRSPRLVYAIIFIRTAAYGGAILSGCTTWLVDAPCHAVETFTCLYQLHPLNLRVITMQTVG